MIELEVLDFQWVKGTEDDPLDHCAHGRVNFRINATRFVEPDDGIWTASASALYLLRTLTENSTSENSVAEGNFMFPCCAFCVWPIEHRFEVVTLGCPNGIDVEIIHQGKMVIVQSSVGSEIVQSSEWTAAVLDFVESVQEFYSASSPKEEIDDEYDRQGWEAFWEEWKVRYNRARSVTG